MWPLSSSHRDEVSDCHHPCFMAVQNRMLLTCSAVLEWGIAGALKESYSKPDVCWGCTCWAVCSRVLGRRGHAGFGGLRCPGCAVGSAG